MAEALIDLAVVLAVLMLTLEGGEILVRLILSAIEPATQETQPTPSGIDAG